MRSVHIALMFIGLLVASAIGFAEEGSIVLEATVRKPLDRAEITGDQKTALVNVHSSDGIGAARIRRTDEAWPAAVVIRLNVRNLEFFKADNGTVTVQGRLNSKLWEVAPSQPDDLPALITRTNDSIEVALPGILFLQGPKEISVEWINEYRR